MVSVKSNYTFSGLPGIWNVFYFFVSCNILPCNVTYQRDDCLFSNVLETFLITPVSVTVQIRLHMSIQPHLMSPYIYCLYHHPPLIYRVCHTISVTNIIIIILKHESVQTEETEWSNVVSKDGLFIQRKLSILAMTGKLCINCF